MPEKVNYQKLLRSRAWQQVLRACQDLMEAGRTSLQHPSQLVPSGNRRHWAEEAIYREGLADGEEIAMSIPQLLEDTQKAKAKEIDNA